MKYDFSKGGDFPQVHLMGDMCPLTTFIKSSAATIRVIPFRLPHCLSCSIQAALGTILSKANCEHCTELPMALKRKITEAWCHKY